MKIVPGRLKIDSFFVGEVTINLFAENIHMRAKVGYHNSESGANMGSTERTGPWSAETLKKLSEFVEAMEQDIANDLFHGAAAGGGGEGDGTTIAGVPQL